MKKIIISAFFLMSGVAFANAQVADQPQTASTEQVSIEEGYKTVALADLSGSIQAAIKTLAGDLFEVKGVEYDAAKSLTRVTLTNKTDKSEKCVVLSKEGEEVAEACPAK